jgi:hypothetical protein
MNVVIKKEVYAMTMNFNVTKDERKRLVKIISEITEVTPKYLGVPSCAYEVGPFTIGRNGELTTDSEVGRKDIKELIEKLLDAGFEAEENDLIFPEEKPEETGLTIQMPMAPFTNVALENLNKLLEAKGNLIKKALDIDALPIETDEERISFPWFSELPSPDEIKSYSLFITKLCAMVQNQKRITVKAKDVENEKYAFRCFLLRLGFIGAEYKTERKILLRNLSGSSAFKESTPNEADK